LEKGGDCGEVKSGYLFAGKMLRMTIFLQYSGCGNGDGRFFAFSIIWTGFSFAVSLAMESSDRVTHRPSPT
jgi:hypothetical protein